MTLEEDIKGLAEIGQAMVYGGMPSRSKACQIGVGAIKAIKQVRESHGAQYNVHLEGETPK